MKWKGNSIDFLRVRWRLIRPSTSNTWTTTTIEMQQLDMSWGQSQKDANLDVQNIYATTGLSLSSLLNTGWGEGDNIFFKVVIPDAAFVLITFRESMSLLDFVIYMCSCLGLWFGVSVASINPMKLLTRQNRKMFLKFMCRRRSVTSRVNNTRSRLDRIRQDIQEMKSLIDSLLRDNRWHTV
jgi:hypothetical protein